MTRFARLMSVVTATALLVGVCACSSGGPGGSGAGGGSRRVIGVSFYDTTIPLYATMLEGMQAEAKAENAKLVVANANEDAATQISQIRSFITQHVDLIVATPLDPKALVPGYQAAKSAHIPIISFGNNMAPQDEDGFVGDNWSALTVEQLDRVAALLNGHGEIAFLEQAPFLQYVQQMKSGWQSTLARYPGLSVVADLHTGFTVSESLASAGTILDSHPDVNAILCETDQDAAAVAQAIAQRHIPAGKILVAGVNGQPIATDQIEKGYIALTVAFAPQSWGKKVIATATAYLDGHKPTAPVTIPYQVVDKTNLASFQSEWK